MYTSLISNKTLYLSKLLLSYLLNNNINNNNINIKYIPHTEIPELYELAFKNKVDLLFLETISRYGSLSMEYKEILKERINQRREMIITAHRILDVLRELGFHASTFKTFVLFPATPNDVDIIILDDISEKEFNYLVNALITDYNYVVFDKIPYAVTLHDSRKGPHRDPRFKDPYDIDLYYEIAANKLIYFNKKFLEKKTHTRNLDGIEVITLDPIFEVIIQCIHSIVPEQIYLLYHLFTVLTYARSIDLSNIEEVAEETRVSGEVSLCLNITLSLLHTILYNTYNRYSREFFEKGYYRVKPWELTYIITKRLYMDKLFRRSFIDQIISLINTETFRHVVKNILERRTRETY